MKVECSQRPPGLLVGRSRDRIIYWYGIVNGKREISDAIVKRADPEPTLATSSLRCAPIVAGPDQHGRGAEQRDDRYPERHRTSWQSRRHERCDDRDTEYGLPGRTRRTPRERGGDRDDAELDHLGLGAYFPVLHA